MNKYLKYIGGYSLGPIIGAFISFITIPLITYFIAPDEFGKVSMFTLATNLVELVIYLGLDQSYVKYYFEFNKNDVFWNSLIPSFLFSIITSALIMVFYKPISICLFDVENEIVLVSMLALYMPFSVLGRFHTMFARVSERAIRYSAFTILSKLLLLVFCIVFFFITGKQFRSVIYATTLSLAVATLIMMAISYKEISLRGVSLSWTIISKLLKYGLPLIPATIIGWLLNSTDKVMLRSICGYEQLGLYSAALKIVSVLAIVQSCFVAFWTPIAFRWNKEGASIEKYEKVGEIISFVLALLFSLLLLGKDVIISILSPGYHDAVMIIPFLLLHPIMYTMSEVTVVGIYFTGKSTMTIVVAIVSCIINIGGNVLLVPRYGAIGASVATGVSYCVYFWVRTIISNKIWKKFALKKYLLYSVFFLLVCAFNTIIGGPIIYIINTVSFLAVILINLPIEKYLLHEIFSS